jgi:hypothetical protein
MKLLNKVLQILLYALGPFFAYPWKPIINSLFGTSYINAYKHFYDQHKLKFNLLLHFICFFFQIFGNFALLNAIDEKIDYKYKLFSISTLIIWSISLITPKECPMFIKISSIIFIIIAYQIAPLFSGKEIETYGFILFTIVWFLQVLQTRSWTKLNKDSILILVVLAAKLIFGYYLYIYYNGILSKYSYEAITIHVNFIVMSSLMKDPVKPVVIIGSLGSHILSILINEPILYLFGNAFIATSLQGLSHALSGEQATLLKLEEKKPNNNNKMSAEWGHVVYFPNLLLQAMYETFNRKKKE